METKNKWEMPLYMTILLLVVVGLFGEFLFQKNMILGNQMSDQVNAMGAKHLLEQTLVKDHQVALWNPATLSGMPTIDATAGDIMYPPSMVISHFFPTHKRVGVTMVFHIFLAGVFFFVMLRRAFKVPAFISFVGALFYMLNPQLLSHVLPGHDGKIYVITWLPFIIWQLKFLLETPSFWRVVAVSFGVGMSILTSHIQMTYFVMWGMGAYWLMYTIRQFVIDRNVKSALLCSVAFWIAIFMGVAFGAVQLWPAFSFVNDAWSVRGTMKDIAFVASWSLHWGDAFSLWVPDFGNHLQNYWGDNQFKLNSEYVGAMAMIGAALAVIAKPQAWRIFWLGTAIFSFLMSMGQHTPMVQFAYNFIPGVNKFRALSMIMFWFSFASVLLSVFFMKDLDEKFWESLSEKGKNIWEKGLISSMVVLTVLTLLSLNSELYAPLFIATGEKFMANKSVYDLNYAKNFIPALWGWWFMAMTILAMLFFVMKGKLKPTYLIGTMLLFGLVDTIRIDRQFVVVTPSGQFTRTPQAIRDLQSEFKNAPFRIHFTEGTAPIESMAGVYNLEGVNGFHDNELQWYRAFRGEQPTAQHEVRPGVYGRGANFDIFHTVYDSTGQRMLNLASYQMGNPYLNVANCEYVMVMNDGMLMALKNQNALPRISFTQQYQVVDTTVRIDTISNDQGGSAIRKTDRFNRMNELFYSQGHAVRTVVLLEKKPSFPSVNGSTLNPIIPVRWKKYTTNDRIAEVEVPAQGLLRIAEVWYPGWEILLNGKRVEPLRADMTWMALEVSAGKHTVELRPKSLYLGNALAVSAPIWILTILTAIAALVLRRKKVIAE